MTWRRTQLIFIALCVLVVSACSSSAVPPVEPESSTVTLAETVTLEPGQTRLFMTTSGTDVDLPLAAAAIVIRFIRSGIPVDDVTWSEPASVEVDIATDDLERAQTLAATAPPLTFRPVLEELSGGDQGPILTGDVPDEEAILTETGFDGTELSRLRLGPAVLDGSGIEEAKAFENANTFIVGMTLAAGDEGIDTFNALASECFAKTATCPTARIAVALDAVVLTSPTVNVPSFNADSLTISGGFSQAEADALALLIDKPEVFESFTIERVESS